MVQASTSRVSLPAPLRSEHEYQRAVAQFGYKVANQVAVGPSRASSTYDSRAAGWRRPNPRSANQSGGIIRDHSAADDVPSYRRGRVESVSIAVDRDWVYFVTAVDSGKASGCGATGAVPRMDQTSRADILPAPEATVEDGDEGHGGRRWVPRPHRRRVPRVHAEREPRAGRQPVKAGRCRGPGRPCGRPRSPVSGRRDAALAKTLEMWLLTVLPEIYRREAICWLSNPSAMRSSTSRSRPVRVGNGLAVMPLPCVCGRTW